MGLDTLFSLGVLAALAYYCLWEDTLKPLLRGLWPGKTVKSLPRRRAFKQRSERSNVQNALNVGSRHQNAVQPVVNVQPKTEPTAAIAPPAAPGGQGDDVFTLTPTELAQLTEAINLRRDGATVEKAISQAFGVTKGGSEGWKRAKLLFDAATALPGAAPAGTYAAAPAAARPRGRRRAAPAR